MKSGTVGNSHRFVIFDGMLSMAVLLLSLCVIVCLSLSLFVCLTFLFRNATLVQGERFTVRVIDLATYSRLSTFESCVPVLRMGDPKDEVRILRRAYLLAN